MELRQEREEDRTGIAAVHLAAFGGKAEAQLVDLLREGGFFRAGMSWVAETNARITGHVLFSDLSIHTDAGDIACAAMAPVGVLPELQGQGIGSALIRKGLEALPLLGFQAVLVLGDPAYYGRFGFRGEWAEGISSPFSGHHFMGLELKAKVLDGLTGGSVTYPPPFFS